MKLIDKDALVAEIERLERENKQSEYVYNSLDTEYTLKNILSFIDTLEVKEVDLDALGILAKHLIACDAHGITPIYKDRELDILEGLANNKTQKGESNEVD